MNSHKSTFWQYVIIVASASVQVASPNQLQHGEEEEQH
jgi:hypothetical protein